MKAAVCFGKLLAARKRHSHSATCRTKPFVFPQEQRTCHRPASGPCHLPDVWAALWCDLATETGKMQLREMGDPERSFCHGHNCPGAGGWDKRFHWESYLKPVLQGKARSWCSSTAVVILLAVFSGGHAWLAGKYCSLGAQPSALPRESSINVLLMSRSEVTDGETRQGSRITRREPPARRGLVWMCCEQSWPRTLLTVDGEGTL